MERIPLADGGHFVLFNEAGNIKVVFLEVAGSGGTCIAYKGEKVIDGRRRECIVKEYYPDKTSGSVWYERQASDGKLKIAVRGKVDSDCREKLVMRELERQQRNVDRELRIMEELAYDGNHNNPYLYSAQLLRRWGDSTYILLDTAKGRTLENYLENAGGRISLREAIRCGKVMLSILKQTMGKRYVHCDLKPSNIWLPGEEDGAYMIFLDFGSVFLPEEYQGDQEHMGQEDFFRLAEKIIDNEAIGSHSRGYGSPLVQEIHDQKAMFLETRSYEDAYTLVETVRKVNVSVDIYSVMQILFRMVSERFYVGDGTDWRRFLTEEIGCRKAAADFLIDMMKKNERKCGTGYSSVQEAQTDLEILERLEAGDAHPLVLLEWLREQERWLPKYEIEEGLLGEVL